MKVGIDISQIAYEGTGVSIYMQKLIEYLLKIDTTNEYILFFSSLRRKLNPVITKLASEKKNVKVKIYKFPPKFLDLLWNRLHIFPIERFIGNVDIFISSDWTSPPSIKAKKLTILYDLIVYRYPQETATSIVRTQKRRLKWVKKEYDLIICISESTKKDAREVLNIEKERLTVIYPGIE